MSVQKFIDLKSYSEKIGNKTAQLTAIQVKRLAVSKVAVDEGGLIGSIMMSKTAQGYAVHSDSDYALAQEYGLSEYGKPNYTYTPYMRPASDEAEAMIPKLSKIAERMTKW